MTLGTHAIIGAAIATAVPTHPILAFVLGFFSHFALDAIPHWDYSLQSGRNETGQKLDTDMEVWSKDFLIDISKISIDLTLGLLISTMVFISRGHFSPFVIFCGAAGGVFPDALQFVYFKFRREPLTTLQRFHIYIQDGLKVRGAVLGITLQILVVIIAISLPSLL